MALTARAFPPDGRIEHAEFGTLHGDLWGRGAGQNLAVNERNREIGEGIHVTATAEAFLLWKKH